jgi:RimJ/RimL family protein N-acetyltransferase
MNAKLQPVLENEKVLLRPLTQDDFEDLYKVASDPLVWEQHQCKDRYVLEVFTTLFEESIASKGAMVIIDKTTHKIMGSSRFKVVDEAEGVIEIGWSFLNRAYWGGQFNRSFKKLMVNHALQYYKRVVFYVNSENYRSQKAMEKLGGKKENDNSATWVRPVEDTLTYVIDQPL